MVKILLVDDEPDIVYLVKKILQKSGHHVIEAYSGEEALELANKSRPDLVLLDIMMPDLNGWEVSRSLKMNKDTKNLPIIMLTVRTSSDSVEKSFKYAKADAHVGKPASSKEIINTINTVIEASAMN